MAYIAMNKLEHHLCGTDVDEGGDVILIDDRHEDYFNVMLKLSTIFVVFL